MDQLHSEWPVVMLTAQLSWPVRFTRLEHKETTMSSATVCKQTITEIWDVWNHYNRQKGVSHRFPKTTNTSTRKLINHFLSYSKQKTNKNTHLIEWIERIHHDNGFWPVVIDESPQVQNCGRQWHLSCDECIFLFVTLNTHNEMLFFKHPRNWRAIGWLSKFCHAIQNIFSNSRPQRRRWCNLWHRECRSSGMADSCCLLHK